MSCTPDYGIIVRPSRCPSTICIGGPSLEHRPLRRAPQAGKRRDGLVTTQQRWSVLILLPEEFRFALNLCRGGRATLLLLVPLRLRLLLLFGASLLTLGHGILLCCRVSQ